MLEGAALYYFCKRCNHIIVDPKEIADNEVGYMIQVCPYCFNAQSLVSIEKCLLCGQWFPSNDIASNACGQCKKMLTETFESLLGECFTSEERFILNEIYDGLEF